MDNFIPYIVLVVSLFSIIYSIFGFLLWKKMRSNNYKEVVIMKQRDRIEKQIYTLNEILLSDINRLFDSSKLLLEFPEKDLSISNKIPNYSFFENFGLDMSTIKAKEKTVFCLMPFNHKFDKIHNAIKLACDNVGYTCFRSDESFITGNILRQILQMMMSAELIVAVLDGKNPNVFYEVGIAHSIGKTVILIGNTKNPDNISFDLKSERLLLYNSLLDLQKKLANSLKQVHYVQ